MHCFEGPEWNYLKRGRESYARGPIVKADPQGRCGGALVYDLQMVVLKAAQVDFIFFSFFSSYSNLLMTSTKVLGWLVTTPTYFGISCQSWPRGGLLSIGTWAILVCLWVLGFCLP